MNLQHASVLLTDLEDLKAVTSERIAAKLGRLEKCKKPFGVQTTSLHQLAGAAAIKPHYHSN